jgi:hypothetical protein
MRNSIKTILFSLAVISNNFCNASGFSALQDTAIILPDGKFIKGDRLQPYHMYLTSYSLTNDKELKTGSVDDTYQVIKINNKKYGLRVAKIILPGREILDSGLVDLSTLKPVFHRSHQTTKTMLLNFDGNKVTGTIETNQQKDTVNASYSHPLFDSYYETLIARTIELKDGFIFKYPDYIYEEGGLVWQSGKVEKTSDSPFGKNIWTITYTDSRSGRKTTYWIDKERKLIRLQYQFGDKISIQKPE